MGVTAITFPGYSNYSDGGFIPQMPTAVSASINFTDLSYRSRVTHTSILYQFDEEMTESGEPVLHLLGNYPYQNETSATYTSYATLPIPSYPYLNHKYNIIVQYINSRSLSETILGAESFEYNIRGRWGAYPTPIKVDDAVTYPIINDTVLEFTRTEGNYTDEKPGSALKNATTHRTWDWLLNYNGESTWDTAANFESRGLIKVIYITETSPGSQGQVMGVFRLKFLETGNYIIGGRMYWKNDENGNIQGLVTKSRTYTAYSPSNPAFEIGTITPEEYKTGDTNPRNGLPPYTLTFVDKTVETDAMQIPQKTVVINYGDPDSGASNKYSITNAETTLQNITIPPHVFSAYGPYTITMTIVDKLDNNKSYSVSFTPNIEPRIIKQPTLTPRTGDQPLLITGQAYLAGDPAPTAEWDYELQGGDPNYYAGSKTGEFVEISLLAGGTYDVICKTLDSEGTEIERESFEVIVNPQTVYANNPAAMQDFDLIVYDRSTDRVIDRCRQHSTVRYVENYQSADTFSLRLPVTYPHLDQLYEGDKITIGYLGTARHMIVTNRDDGKDSVEISGIDYASYLMQRRPSITATRSTSDNGYDLQRCSAEALIRYFAISNLSGLRAAAKFRVVDANLDRGGVTKYSARYETTEQIISELCKTSGLGWGASLQDESSIIVGFKVTKGTDRTASTGGANAVIFSERLKNAKIGNYYGVLAPNVAIGAGAGNGASREYSFFGETTATDVDRREVFVDAGDAADAEEVQRMAELELENQKQQSVSVRPLQTCQWVFGTDYNVGDIVTIEHPTRGVLELQIVSADYCRHSSGDELTLTCGYIITKYLDEIKRTNIANSYARK